MSQSILDRLSESRSFHRRANARRILVAIPQLGLLKVVAGTLRSACEHVVETADLTSAPERVRIARRVRAFHVVLVDLREGHDAAAVLTRRLRESDPEVRILARQIDATQSAEIRLMDQLLAQRDASPLPELKRASSNALAFPLGGMTRKSGLKRALVMPAFARARKPPSSP